MLNGSSYILPEEVEEAKEMITELLGFPPPEVPSNLMAVKIFVRDEDIVVTTIEGKQVSICMPAEVSIRDGFRSCVALVLSQGPECYKSKRYEKTGPWCRVGDWIFMPRNEGTQHCYRDIPIQIIKEDMFFGVLESPKHVHKLME